MKRFLVLSAALLAAACSQAETEPQEVVVVEEAPVAGSPVTVETLAVTVVDPYILAPLKGRDVTAGYFVIENAGPNTRLVSASSPIAAEVEIHTHSMADGVMQMREVDGVDLVAGETIAFEPGGLHLMMFGFARDEGQTETPVTLDFANGDSLTLSVPIRDRE